MALGDSTTGAQDIIFDGEVPRSFTGRAREVLSGGQFVTVSGAANVIGADSSGFSPGSIVVAKLVDSDYAVGIALHNAGSNEIVSVATRGMYISRSAGVISGGVGVYPYQAAIQGVKAMPIGISYSGTQVGRAITAAASGTASYLLVNYSF